MIFYAETVVPKAWYKADYDIEKYPDFEFKFIKDCYVRKAHNFIFIKPVDNEDGNVLELNNVSGCNIFFPHHFVGKENMEEIIERFGKYTRRGENDLDGN